MSEETSSRSPINSTAAGYAVIFCLAAGYYAFLQMTKKKTPVPLAPIDAKFIESSAKEVKAKKQRQENYRKEAAAQAASSKSLPIESDIDVKSDSQTASEKKKAKKKAAKEKKAAAALKLAESSQDEGISSAAEKSTGVSDMLERAGPGPSSLRITNTEDHDTPASVKTETLQTETKKQRQNRKKAEAAKAERAEVEAERLEKLEAQRRSARIAEGRAAPDGTAFMASQNKTWTDSKPSIVQPQLLDTLKSGAIPSEEEQMNMLNEDEWSTVPAKAKKVKKEVVDERAPVAAPQKLAPIQPIAAPIAPSKAPTLQSSGAPKSQSHFVSSDAPKSAIPLRAYGKYLSPGSQMKEWSF